MYDWVISPEKPLVCGTIWFSMQFRISKGGVGKRLHRVLVSRFYHHFSFLLVECWHCPWHMQDRRHAICLSSTLEKVLNSEIGSLLLRIFTKIKCRNRFYTAEKMTKSQRLKGVFVCVHACIRVCVCVYKPVSHVFSFRFCFSFYCFLFLSNH